MILVFLFLLLAFRLLGFAFKVAGFVIKIIFRILIFPMLILTAIWGYPVVALIVFAVVLLGFIISGAFRKSRN